MKKTGNTLESHRLWREIAKLPTAEADKVLAKVVEEKFSIGEAMKVVRPLNDMYLCIIERICLCRIVRKLPHTSHTQGIIK